MKNTFRTIAALTALGFFAACGAIEAGPPEADTGDSSTGAQQQPPPTSNEGAISKQPAETNYRPGDCCYAQCLSGGYWDGPFNLGRLSYGTCTEHAARFCQDNGYYASHPFWDRC